MTEKKSGIRFTVGMLLTISPIVFFLGNIFALGLANLVAVSTGIVMVCMGFFIMSHAHEHAKALDPCGTHAQRIE